MQALVELARALATNRPMCEVTNLVENLNEDLERKARSPKKFLYLLTVISIPNFEPAFASCARAETRRRMTIAAIALQRYQLKRGQFPSTLDALVPEFLRNVPIDCMSGRALHYRLSADGRFNLYSVGEDGQDNGGDPTPVPGPQKPGLWEGRDAVWPLAEDHKGEL